MALLTDEEASWMWRLLRPSVQQDANPGPPQERRAKLRSVQSRKRWKAAKRLQPKKDEAPLASVGLHPLHESMHVQKQDFRYPRA